MGTSNVVFTPAGILKATGSTVLTEVLKFAFVVESYPPTEPRISSCRWKRRFVPTFSVWVPRTHVRLSINCQVVMVLVFA